MFFNPLFLQVINNPESLSTAKAQKLNGSSYLFSDIIKVCLDKNDTEGLNMTASSALSSSTNSFANGMNNIDLVSKNKDVEGINSAEMTLFKLLGQIFPQKYDLGASENSGTSFQNMGEVSTTNSGDLSNSMLLNENEVTALISRLLSNNFNGKINILSDKSDSNNSGSDEKKLAGSNLTSTDLLGLLKEGKTISLESETDTDNQGLLISLVEVNKGAFLNNPFLSPALAVGNSNTDDTKSYSDGSSTISTGSNPGTVQGNTTVSNNSIDQLSGISPDVSNKQQPQYQIELSFLNGQESSSVPNVYNMFSEPTNTTELQEVINSKGIKLPDGSTLNFNKTVNENSVSQNNIGVSTDAAGAQTANAQNMSPNIGSDNGSDSILGKSTTTQGNGVNASESVPLSESSSIKIDTNAPTSSNIGSEKGTIDLINVKTNNNNEQQSKVDNTISVNNSQLNTEKSSATATAVANDSSLNGAIAGDKTGDPLTANLVENSSETTNNSGVKASTDPLTSKELSASEQTTSESQKNSAIETSADKNITTNNVDINNLQNKKSRIIKDLNLSVSSSKAQKDAA
jgi:hypothetical protein